MTPRIFWVVALRPEANPIIQHWGLKHSAALSSGSFQVFAHPDKNNHFLIISGVGKVNAAAATAWLAAVT
ncbi:MAG: hypothetical protein AAF226_19170, partial [Verrucomicrobiota bacterium]